MPAVCPRILWKVCENFVSDAIVLRDIFTPATFAPFRFIDLGAVELDGSGTISFPQIFHPFLRRRKERHRKTWLRANA